MAIFTEGSQNSGVALIDNSSEAALADSGTFTGVWTQVPVGSLLTVDLKSDSEGCRRMIEKEIFESKTRGVWCGYIREKYGEEALDKLIESGDYVKMKKIDPLHSPENKSGSLWAIVAKGFDKKLTSTKETPAKTIKLTPEQEAYWIKRMTSF
jgi:hypothetical protein